MAAGRFIILGHQYMATVTSREKQSMRLKILQCKFNELWSLRNTREVKFDVYGKRQTANGKLLPSVFSSLYSRIKIFVFAVNCKRHFSIFV